MLKLENITIDNHVHTHIKGGGGSATTIERALLLLRSTFIQIRGGADAIATTEAHSQTQNWTWKERVGSLFIVETRKRGGTKLNMNMFSFIHKI